MTEYQLTPDQELAAQEIQRAFEPGRHVLLTGHAGSGKTTVVRVLAETFAGHGLKVVLSAPTHKAVAVLARQLNGSATGQISCRTIHSVLNLKPKANADRLLFRRSQRAAPVTADVVFVDEASMVDDDLYRHIRRYLPNSFVILVGDDAQLPPIGELKSPVFSTAISFRLTSTLRQNAGNPIISLATKLREEQGGPWSRDFLAAAVTGDRSGVHVLRTNPELWLRKAFTSAAFQADSDSFRYLAWRNSCVDRVNRSVREWRYGRHISSPFVVGERASFRAPVVIDDEFVFLANDEAEVLMISESIYSYEVAPTKELPGWTAQIPAWEIVLLDDRAEERTVFMSANQEQYQRVVDKITDEAAESRLRWEHLHEFKSSVADLQSIYALTVHRSQGSTFGTVFVDVSDIEMRFFENCLEAQQLLYVAVTRASKQVILLCRD